MRNRTFCSLLFAVVLILVSALGAAHAQIAPPGAGGHSLSPTQPTDASTPDPSSTLSLRSGSVSWIQIFLSNRFASWGTTVTHSGIRTSAFVLRERRGLQP